MKRLCQIGALYRQGTDDDLVEHVARRRIAVGQERAAGRTIGDGGWTGERGADDREREANDRELGADDRKR